MKISRKQFVKEWIKALKSGNYIQTTEALSTAKPDTNGHYSYCCLGVACQVGKKLGIKGAGFANEHNDIPDQSRVDGLPGNWFKIIMGSDDPLLSESLSCSQANDQEEWNFSKIAKALEDKYL